MRTLITGSFAYDTIMMFQDRFKNHILPDQVHILNVSFLVPEMRKEFGGCAGNIAYNLNLLGGSPVAMGAVGEDFRPYRKWMEKNGIAHSHVTEIANTYTAQAFVTTDTDNNQISAFHPGAMMFAHQNKVADAADIGLGIVAPNGKEAMLEHAAHFSAADIPFFFDPGQGLPMFNSEQLQTFINQATYVCVNDYESELLTDKTGLTLQQIAKKVDALIITRGGNGSDIFADGKTFHIDPVKVSAVKDPTGCGDAFRSGLLYGTANQWDWQTSGQLASLMGGIKVEQPGTQNHSPSRADIEARYRENFGGGVSLG